MKKQQNNENDNKKEVKTIKNIKNNITKTAKTKKNNTKNNTNNNTNDIFTTDDVILYDYIYSTLSTEEQSTYDEIFAGYNMDLFYEAVEQSLGAPLDEMQKRQSLSDFNRIKTILIMLHKSQYLSERVDSLLASIILNVKTAILLGEDKIRELGDMCALFAINQAQEIVNKLDDVNSDTALSAEEKAAIDKVKVELDVFLGNKEIYLERILEYAEQMGEVNDENFSYEPLTPENNKNIN